MIYAQKSYRSYLKEVLVERSSRNPNYSLRAMARQLELSPASLSGIFNGKKNLSLETAVQVATKVDLVGPEKEYFLLMVQFEATKNPQLKEAVAQMMASHNPQGDSQDLELERFKVIAEWHHFAILASTELENFSSIPSVIAVNLGIGQQEAELAIDRLIKVGLLEKNSEGRLCKTLSHPVAKSDATNSALKKFHVQTLKKAIESLENHEAHERRIGSETIAIDDDQLEEYGQLMEDFFNRALALAKSSKKKNHVYHLGVQFYRMSKQLSPTPKKSFRRKP